MILSIATQVLHSAPLSAGNESWISKLMSYVIDLRQLLTQSRTEVTAMMTSYINEEKEKAKRCMC